MSRANKSRGNHAVEKPAIDQDRPGPGNSVPQWKSLLGSYPQKSILIFASEKDLEAAIDLLWSDALRTLPHETPDGQSLVVPTEAVVYFSNAGLRFREKRLHCVSDPVPEEEKSK